MPNVIMPSFYTGKPGSMGFMITVAGHCFI